MRTKEIEARKATMTEAQIDTVRRMLRQGYSDTAIVRECSPAVTLKQVNALVAEYKVYRPDVVSTGNYD